MTKLLRLVIRNIMEAMTEIQNLLGALQDKGWTKAAIADAVEVDYSTIYKWEKGIHTPSNEGPVRKVLETLLTQRRIPKRRRYTSKRNAATAKD
jgi:DNA-binding XRE family transcriptional regulator